MCHKLCFYEDKSCKFKIHPEIILNDNHLLYIEM